MKTLIILLLLSFYYTSHAQVPMWTNGIGSSDNDDSYSIDYDDSGNVYLAGWFSGTADFDPGVGVYNLTSAGITDVFVAKYNHSGQLVWAFRIGQYDRDGAMKVKINNSGEVLVTGFVRQNNIDFDPGPGSFLVNAPGLGGTDPGHSGDIFLAKYSNGGQFIWAFVISGSYNSDLGESIDVDSLDNIYLTGAINATSTTVADADPGIGVYNLAGAGKGHAFVAKYSTSSNFIWAFQLGTFGQNSSVKRIRMIPGDTTFVISGHHISTNADFDPGPGVYPMNSNGNTDMFCGRYSINGKFIWAIGVGGSSQDLGMELRLDSFNNIYVSGSFSGSNVDFNPGVISSNLTSNGGTDGYIAKYDVLGNYIWAKNIGGSGNDFNWTIDILGNILLSSGEFTQTVDFDPSPAVYNLSSNGMSDAYFAQFDLMGNFLCASSIGGISEDRIFSMEKFTTDTFFSCGSFSNAVDFDPNTNSLILTSVGVSDGFLAKYSITSTSNTINPTLIGDTICTGELAYITVVLPSSFTGQFDVTFSDGANIYTSSGVTSGIPFLLPLIPGSTTTYYFQNITFTSISGCGNTFSVPNSNVTVYLNTSPQISTIALPNTVCLGGATTLTATGGGSYTWTGGVTNGNSFVPSATSTYTVTGTDINGCSSTSSVLVTVLPLPSVTANTSPTAICVGTGVTLTGSGANSYFWSGGVINGQLFYPTTTSNYIVTGTDANGCSNTSSVIVIVNPLPTVQALANPNPVCLGSPLTLTGSGANQYTWSGSVQNNIPFTPSSTATYTVIGTDANGCQNSDSITVSVLPIPQLSISPTDTIICFGDSVSITTQGASTYTWNPNSDLFQISYNSVSAFPPITTNYLVTGTDAMGCSATIQAQIQVKPPIDIQITKNRDANCTDRMVELQVEGAQTYQWQPENSLNNGVNNSVEYNVPHNTLFTVTGSMDGCTGIDSIWVFYNPTVESALRIPNAFTPNGDGLNDCFRIIYHGEILKFYLAIYDRWGQRIYETNDSQSCWNGEFNNYKVDLGTYFYMLEFSTPCGQTKQFGDITLIY